MARRDPSRHGTMSASAAPRLALHGITKRYGHVIANDHVDLLVAPGEIHAVLGENGAGKSTLMKIVYGSALPDSGTLVWEGQPRSIRSPAQARRLGIGMVFQHFSLYETLTVTENVALALGGGLPRDTLAGRIREVSQRYGLPVDPDRLVHGMSVGERQRVEIVRCLLQSPRLLIMDEPTSVLTPDAVRSLFDTLRRLAAEGVSILYISHKLDEIRDLCDVATVLRQGKVTGRVLPRQETNASLARLMVGGELSQCRLQPRAAAAVRLEVQGLSLSTADPFGTPLRNVSLRVHGGEIVGIAGVSGNGQKELCAALSGETACEPKGVRIEGRDVGALDPAQRRALGLRFVPEERLGRGAVPAMDLAENCVLTSARLLRRGVIRARAAREFARDTIARFAVKCTDERALAYSLSGGNLQKFIVGREIRQEPRVLLVAQPTWGVDVGAAVVIHQALIDLRNAGVAVLIVSEELEELFAICDRVAVMAGGRLSTVEPTASMTAGRLGQWMAGDFEAARGPAHAAP